MFKNRRVSSSIKKKFRTFAMMISIPLLGLGMLFPKQAEAAGTWVFETIPNTPKVDGWTQWGQNGFAIVEKGTGDKSYLYIYGRHYRSDSAGSGKKPDKFVLQMYKWDNDQGRFVLYKKLSETYYQSYPYFYNNASTAIPDLPNGVYSFKHVATIAGETDTRDVNRKVTFSNWMTVGGDKAALLYYDSSNDDSKLRVRTLELRNTIASTTFNSSSGLVLTVKSALVAWDNGYDVTAFDNGSLVKYSDNYWHVKGDNDTGASGSNLYLRKGSTDIYSTYNGTESSLSGTGYRYQKSGLTIPVSTLKGLSNGTYNLDFEMNVDSGEGAVLSKKRDTLSGPSTTYSFKMAANDGYQRLYTFKNSNGDAVIEVTDAEPPTASTSQSPANGTWTNGSVTLTVSNIADKGGSGYDRTQLPNGTYVTSTSANYTVSANGTYKFVIYDKAGNSTTKSFTVSNIDKTSPTITIATDGNSTYAKSHSTKVTVSDDKSGIQTSQYAWSTSNSTEPSSWTNFSSGDTITTPSSSGGQYLWVKVTDQAGNVTITKSNVFRVDVTAPTASTSQSPANGTWTNGSVTLTLSNISDSGGSGYKNTKLPDGSYITTTTTTYTVTTNGTYSFVIYDHAGNSTTKSFTVSNIDKTAPNVSFTVNGNSNYAKSHSTVVNATDGQSGIKSVQYAWSTSNTTAPTSWNNTSNGTSLSTPNTTGVHYLWVKVTDNAGNETIGKSNGFYVDLTAPSFTASPSNGEWAKNAYVVTPSYADSHSGISSMLYAWSTGTATPSSWNTYSSGSLTQPGSGVYYLHYKAVDKAGNEKVGYVGPYRYDNTAPTATLTQEPSSWTSGNVTLNLTNVSDALSGIKSITLPNGTTITGSSASQVVTENGTYTFKITDHAGNVTQKSVTVSNIDRTKPVITIEKNGSSSYGKSHSTKVTFSDSGSGVKTSQYAWSASNTTEPTSWSNFASGTTISTPNSTGTHYLWIRVSDQVGNTETVISNGFKVDVSLPTFSVSPSSGSWKNTPHVVTPNYGDGHSGVQTKQYAWSTGTSTPTTWNTYTSGTLTQPGTGTYYLHYRVVDQAGNEKTGYVGPYRYENTTPTATQSQSPANGTWTNGSVTLTLSNISDSGGSGYKNTKLPDGSYVTSTSASYTATTNGTYTFVITDQAGNATTITFVVSNIDKSSPKVQFNPNGNETYAKSHSTSVIVSDEGGSGMKEQKWAWSTSRTTEPSDWNNLNNGVSITTLGNTGTYYLWVKVSDQAGNSVTSVSNAFKVDTTEPTFRATPSDGIWKNTPYEVTPTIGDSHSGVDSSQVAWSTSTTAPSVWSNYTGGTLKQPGIGTYYLHYKITDKAGNIKQGYTGPYRYENEAPKGTLVQTPTDWTNKEVTLNVKDVTDSGGSGVKSIRLPNGNVVNGTSASQVVSENGTYTFLLTDHAGNETTLTAIVNNIDKMTPNAKSNQYPIGWTNGDVTLSLTDIEDIGNSGYYRTLLPDGTYSTAQTVTYKVNSNGEYRFIIYDRAGNQLTKSFQVSNIDKVKPQGTLTYSDTNPINHDVTITLKATDEGSGVKSIQLPNGTIVNGSTVSYTMTGNGKVSFIITDHAGNQTTVTGEVTNIDKTPPVLHLEPSTNEWTKETISIKATASDERGVVQIILPNGNVVNGTSTTFSVRANGTYSFMAKDPAGNTTSRSITITNFDGDKPKLEMDILNETSTRIDIRLKYGD